MVKAKRSRRGKRFDYSKDRKKLYRKTKRKMKPHISCATIREAWDGRKNAAKNMAEMGLVTDPNIALPLSHDQGSTSLGDETLPMETDVITVQPPKKAHVVKALTEEASHRAISSLTLSREIIMFVQHMVATHGENYKAMSRDDRNYYQETPRQIRRKIILYRQHYANDWETFQKQQKERAKI
uniref:Nucleolar protein 16 n=1 Tax=Eptatretus burgeri TaxID=7764 RepID=A0A8C4QN23_EPTBU